MTTPMPLARAPETHPLRHPASDEGAQMPMNSVRDYTYEPKVSNDVFVPTERSRGTRRPSLRRLRSYSGSLPILLNGRLQEFVFESRLEGDAILAFSRRLDVVDMIEQAQPVTYRSADGSLRSMTPDLLVTLADGRRIFCAIKPKEKAIKYGLLDELALIAAQISPDVATHVTLIDETSFSRDDVADGRLFQAVRRDPPSDDDQVLRDLCAGLQGTFCVEDLIQASRLPKAAGFRAAARLAASGFLVKVENKAFSPQSRVMVGSGQA